MPETSDATQLAESVTSTSMTTWLLLLIGVLAVSASAIFVRYAGQVHPLAISFWRCFSGAAVLLPFAGAGLKKMQARQMALPAVAGVFLWGPTFLEEILEVDSDEAAALSGKKSNLTPATMRAI